MSLEGRSYVVEERALPGVKWIASEPHRDNRGENWRLWGRDEFKGAVGVDVEFVEDDVSVSHRGVLRGIHCDPIAWKLLTCLSGSVCVVVVDCREGTKSFGRHCGFYLSGHKRQQVLVPPDHGVAHLVMSDAALFHYKVSAQYDLGRQRTYKWDDPRFGIAWPPFSGTPILSERDS